MGYSPWGRKELDMTDRLHCFPMFPMKKDELYLNLVLEYVP